MNTYDINKIKLPNGDICNLRDSNLDNFIQISDLQLTDDGTKIWISTNEAEEYEVPTYDEFLELKDQAMLTRAIDETNLIHIEDAAEKPLKECKIDIQPIQDLHGYDKPWPGGANINQWNYSESSPAGSYGLTSNVNNDGLVTIAGAYYGAARNPSFTIFNESNIPYNDNQEFYVFNKNTEAEAHLASVKWLGNNGGIAVDLKDMVNDYTYNLQFKIVLCDKSITPTEWTPYANICPITGFDSVKVTRTGKNLLDNTRCVNRTFSGITRTVQQDKSIILDGVSASASQWYSPVDTPFLTLPPGTYTVSCEVSFRLQSTKNGLNQYTPSFTNGSATFTINEITTFTNARFDIGTGTTVNNLVVHPQLEFGSTATTYEPYSDSIYSITFPTETGTVYGGSLDVTNGVLTVDRAMVDLGTLTWIDENNNVSGQFRCNFTDYKPNFGGNLICSILKGYPFRDWDAVQNGEITLSNSAVLPLLRVRDSLFINMSATEIAEYLSGQTLVYELATPVTYQLTPQEVTTLLGINNIWADTGNISCTYYVNSQLNTELNNYISKLPGTEKGDMIYYSDNTTPSRLEIGNQGQVLKVNSDGVPHWNNENIAEYKTLTDQEIATFDDGIQNSTLKSYSVKIEPKQDLHGYDHPWIDGTGKNLLPPLATGGQWNNVTLSNGKNGAIIATGTSSGSGGRAQPKFQTAPFILKSGTYTTSCTTPYNTARLQIVVQTYPENVVLSPGAGYTFTLNEDTEVTVGYNIGTDTVYNGYPQYFQLELGSVATAYEPYSNICPIQGFDIVKIIRTGKNLLDPLTIKNGYYLPDRYGSVYFTGNNNYRSIDIKLPAGTYTCSTSIQNAVFVRRFIDNEEYQFSPASPRQSNTFTLDKTSQVKFTLRNTTTTEIEANATFQIELGSAPTAYEPFGKSFSIDFPTSTGSIVYSGILTINENGTGTITVDKAAHICDGTEIVDESSTNGYMMIGTSHNAFMAKYNIPNNGAVGGPIPIVSHYKGRTYKQSSELNVGDSCTFYGVHQGSIGFYTIFDETTEFKQYLTEQYQAGTPVTFILPLTNPQTYTLTASQLSILLGTNHIWSDAGNITLTYPVNLKGYIDSINNLTDNYVKYTDYATNDTCGVVKTNGAFGILTDNTGLLKLVQPTDTEIQTATGMYKVITPYSQHKAAFYGLAKAAGDTTQASSTNSVGNYTQDAKTSIQDMLGISDIIAPVQETTIASKTHLPNEKFYYKGKIYKVNSVIFADNLITPGVNCEQITLAEAMPVSIIEGQGTNSLVLNDLIKTNATGVKSVAEGTSKAKAGYSHAEGQESEASGGASHAEGWYSKAKGAHSHAEGGLDDTRGKIKITGAANVTTYTYTVVDNDFVENFGNHALYYKNSVYYISAIDVAGKTITVTETLSASTALSNVQVSWGTYSYAEGTNAHAENSAYAYSQGSHAEGVSVSAELYSHAEGKSYTIGEYSHAENNSIAAGNYSHAQGYGSTLGAYAHAQGYNTSAEGANSHVEGQHTTASRKNQHVFGKYNIKDEPANTTSDDLGTYVEIVGNGTSTSATSNARTLDWNGNEVLAGSLTIGGSEVLNKTTLQQLKKMPVNIVDGNGTNSIVLGNISKAKATGTRAIAEATGTATGNNSHAEGWSTEAKATAAHSEGYFSKAVGSYSHAEGGYYSTFGTIHVTGAANATTYTYTETLDYLEDGPNYLIVYNNTIYTVSSVNVTNKTITLTSTLNSSAAVLNLAVDLATTPYAYGNRSHAEGSAYAQGQLSHAQGNCARASGFGSHAEGKWAKASGQYSHVEGYCTQASAQEAHAEGIYTSATSDYAHAEGNRSQATAAGAHAEGGRTEASGQYSHAEGYTTQASGLHSHAEGQSTVASKDSTHAEGRYSKAMAMHSHAEGGLYFAEGKIAVTGAANATTYSYTVVTNDFDGNHPNYALMYNNDIYYITNINSTQRTIILDRTLDASAALTNVEIPWYPYSYTLGVLSHAEGSAYALGHVAHAEGTSFAQGSYTHAQGHGHAIGNYSHAQGDGSFAAGKCSHSEGSKLKIGTIVITGAADATTFTYSDAHTGEKFYKNYPNSYIIYQNQMIKIRNVDTTSKQITLDRKLSSSAINRLQVDWGTYSYAKQNCSHSEGTSCAYDEYAHAEGVGTVAAGWTSHSEGYRALASGDWSHAQGYETVASYNSAHAEGQYTEASNSGSHAEGDSTKASGSYSHAEGSYTIASADYAHAEGVETQASGESSHSEGYSTVANHASQHVFGEYNIVDTSSATADSRGTYVEIVGNGNDVTRSNARTLDWNGNETLAGNLTLGDHTLMPQAVPSVIFGTQTGTTAAWTGVAPFSTLIDGTVILYWLPQTSASNATLNLTLANGLTTGAKNIYIDGTTRCGTQIASGNLILMMYRNKPIIGSATNLQGWWIVKS